MPQWGHVDSAGQKVCGCGILDLHMDLLHMLWIKITYTASAVLIAVGLISAPAGGLISPEAASTDNPSYTITVPISAAAEATTEVPKTSSNISTPLPANVPPIVILVPMTSEPVAPAHPAPTHEAPPVTPAPEIESLVASKITVQNVSERPAFYGMCGGTVNPTQTFLVKVLDQNGDSMDGQEVIFDGSTGIRGFATTTAPLGARIHYTAKGVEQGTVTINFEHDLLKTNISFEVAPLPDPAPAYC